MDLEYYPNTYVIGIISICFHIFFHIFPYVPIRVNESLTRDQQSAQALSKPGAQFSQSGAALGWLILPMEVSWNGGIPKSSILVYFNRSFRLFIINQPAIGDPPLMETPKWFETSNYMLNMMVYDTFSIFVCLLSRQLEALWETLGCHHWEWHAELSLQGRARFWLQGAWGRRSLAIDSIVEIGKTYQGWRTSGVARGFYKS